MFKIIKFTLLLVFIVTTSCFSFFKSDNCREDIHWVQKGEQLESIAYNKNVSLTRLAELNHLSPTTHLYEGQKIKFINCKPVSSNQAAAQSKDKSLQQSMKASMNHNKNGLPTIRLDVRARNYIGKLGWPIPNGQLSSRFGYRSGRIHEGIDIRAPEGTSIYATHDGQVIYSGSGMNGYGNMIAIRGDGILTLYAHNKKNLVDRGDRIKKQDKIALVGKTGRASGYHVHYEIRVKDSQGYDVAVDPLFFYKNVK